MMNTFLINVLEMLINGLQKWRVKLIKKQIKSLKGYNSWHNQQMHRNNQDVESLEKRLSK